MNLALVSPAWRRFEVTRLALAERRWLCDELASRGHEAWSVIVADDENLEIAREYGFDTVEMDNSDLGRKFNAGYKYAADQGADVFVHVGSDDWVHPDTFAILGEVDLETFAAAMPPLGQSVVWRRAPQCVAQRHVTLVDLGRGTLQRCIVLGNYGCIPWLIPRVAMESVGFAPIQPGLRRGIDGALVRGMRSRPNWVFQESDEDWCVDFKSPVNLTPYRGLVHSLGYGEALDPWPVLAEKYPADLVEMAQRVHETVAEETRELDERFGPLDRACELAGVDLVLEHTG